MRYLLAGLFALLIIAATACHKKTSDIQQPPPVTKDTIALVTPNINITYPYTVIYNGTLTFVFNTSHDNVTAVDNSFDFKVTYLTESMMIVEAEGDLRYNARIRDTVRNVTYGFRANICAPSARDTAVYQCYNTVVIELSKGTMTVDWTVPVYVHHVHMTTGYFSGSVKKVRHI